MTAGSAACQDNYAVSQLVSSFKGSLNSLVTVGDNTDLFLMLNMGKHLLTYFVYIFFSRIKLGNNYKIRIFLRYFPCFFAAVKGFFTDAAEYKPYSAAGVVFVYIIKKCLIAHLVVCIVNYDVNRFLRNCVKLHSAGNFDSLKPLLDGFDGNAKLS